MGWWQRLWKGLTKSADAEERFWQDSGWSAPSLTGIRIDQQTALNASAVMACVTMLAEDVAKCAPALFRQDSRGKRVPATDHPLYPLLYRPNPWQNWMEFAEQMQVGLIMRGNGYAAIIANGRGAPVKLVPVNPDWVSLWEAVTGELFYRVTPQGLHLRAQLMEHPFFAKYGMFPFEDMLHVRGFSLNGLMGLSRIGLAREAVALFLAQERQAARWMGNRANPSGVLTTEQKLSPDAATRMAADWKRVQGGLDNSGNTVVLEQGLKFEKLSMTSSDLEFIASRQFQLHEIARIFRVPAHMIGDLSRSTNNNIVQQSQEYINYTISGFTERWENKLDSTFGLRDQGVSIEFDLGKLLRADVVSRFNIYRTGVMSMLLTPNEARVDAGYDPSDDPEADKLQKPVNMATIGSQSSGTAPDDAGRPADGASTPGN